MASVFINFLGFLLSSLIDVSIGLPLGFLIDRLNTSASLYRIAPCLTGQVVLKNQVE